MNRDRPISTWLSRRVWLSTAFNGIGAMALNALVTDAARGDTTSPLASKIPHLRRKAKHCIFLFMQGGVSQMDSLDHKPVLNEFHGKPLPRNSFDFR